MTRSVSSSEPDMLLQYATRSVQLDYELLVQARRLQGVLQRFEATCTEPGFRVRVSHLPGWLHEYALLADQLGKWVRSVGVQFRLADEMRGLQQILKSIIWSSRTLTFPDDIFSIPEVPLPYWVPEPTFVFLSLFPPVLWLDDLRPKTRRIAWTCFPTAETQNNFREVETSNTKREITPPPRVYIVNGVGSNGVPEEFEKNFEGQMQLKDDEVRSIHAFPEKPLDLKGTNLSGTDLQGSNLKGANLEGTHLQGAQFKTWGQQPSNWITGVIASGTNVFTGAAADTTNALTDTGTNMINEGTGASAGITNVVTGLGAQGINAATGKVTSTANKVADIGYDSLQVGADYVLGDSKFGQNFRYTDDLYAEIKDDIDKNPLKPGQKVVLVGHSGGSAPNANVVKMLEDEGIADVEMMVAMGSPVYNRDQAAEYANVIEIRERGDAFSLPWARGRLGPDNASHDIRTKWVDSIDGWRILDVDEHTSYWGEGATDVIREVQSGHLRYSGGTL